MSGKKKPIGTGTLTLLVLLEKITPTDQVLLRQPASPEPEFSEKQHLLKRYRTLQ